jgi:hypothetical protein
MELAHNIQKQNKKLYQCDPELSKPNASRRWLIYLKINNFLLSTPIPSQNQRRSIYTRFAIAVKRGGLRMRGRHLGLIAIIDDNESMQE